MAQDTVDVALVCERSYNRVLNRIGEGSPCRDGDKLVCPFCDNGLEVRRTVLGYLDSTDGENRPHIDGVQMKCAGDEGCAFRPDFDVPIGRLRWEEEYAARKHQKLIDAGYSPDNDRSMQDRLRDLGYIIE